MFPKCISQIFHLTSSNVSWGCHPAVEQSDWSLLFPACVDTMSLLEHLLHTMQAPSIVKHHSREKMVHRESKAKQMCGTRTTVRVGNTELENQTGLLTATITTTKMSNSSCYGFLPFEAYVEA